MRIVYPVLTVSLIIAASSSIRMQHNLGSLIKVSQEYLEPRQAILTKEYGLGTYEHVNCSQEQGTLVFSSGGRKNVQAQAQIIGDISSSSGTWLWAWANPSVTLNMKAAANKVRLTGQREGIPQLTSPQMPASDIDAWDYTAVAAKLVAAKGAYRLKTHSGTVYFVITKIKIQSVVK